MLHLHHSQVLEPFTICPQRQGKSFATCSSSPHFSAFSGCLEPPPGQQQRKQQPWGSRKQPDLQQLLGMSVYGQGHFSSFQSYHSSAPTLSHPHAEVQSAALGTESGLGCYNKLQETHTLGTQPKPILSSPLPNSACCRKTKTATAQAPQTSSVRVPNVS